VTRAVLVRHAAVAVAFLVVALLFAVYGLFALVYNDTGGATSVTIAGRRMNADVAGALSLVVGVVLALVGAFIGRRRRS